MRTILIATLLALASGPVRADDGQSRVDVEVGKQAADALVESALREEVTVRVRGGREPARDRYAKAGQRGDHLAERGVLAPDQRDVGVSELLKRDDIWFHIDLADDARRSCVEAYCIFCL